MDDVGVGRTLRALRLRAKLSQAAAAHRAGISQPTWSRIERGHVTDVTLGVIRRAFGAVDARLDLNPTWRGGAVDRLRDERHSAVVAAVVKMLESLGWQTAVEVTYSEFGERGSIDVLAVHPGLRLALVVEVKTEIASQEQMVRRIDEKARLAPKIVYDRYGWRPIAVSRMLVIEATMTNRRRVTALAPILDGAFPLRSDQARAWLRSPIGLCSGLIFVSPTRPRNEREAGRGHLVSATRRVDA
jgi:transcriptional regulator with XRE-family HTH domain